jgi:hypothetical protein
MRHGGCDGEWVTSRVLTGKVTTVHCRDATTFHEGGDAGTVEWLSRSIEGPACDGADGGRQITTYKTPMVMAAATPIFSLRRMRNVMIKGQGRKARARSIAPLYAAGLVRNLNRSSRLGQAPGIHLPPEKRLKLEIALLSQHVPSAYGSQAL